MDISVSVPSDELLEIHLLAHSLLQRQPVTVHNVMSFLGKMTFCVDRHTQIHKFCHVIQSDVLNVYHSPANLFVSFHLFLPAESQLQQLFQLWQNQSLCDSIFLIATKFTRLTANCSV